MPRSRTCSTSTSRTADQGRAVPAGPHRRARRPADAGDRRDPPHAPHGRPRRAARLVGVRRGRNGPGELRDLRGGVRGRGDGRLRGRGQRDQPRRRESSSRTGPRLRAGTVLCNADPRSAPAPARRRARPERLRATTPRVEGPLAGDEGECRAQRPPAVDRRGRRDLAGARDGERDRGHRGVRARVRGLREGRRRVSVTPRSTARQPPTPRPRRRAGT